MEGLHCVWIEGFGNDKKAGFNFSAGYDFEFTYKVENKSILTITESAEKIPKGFFGKNILNLNAIIGENGSGKSTLIRHIRNIHFKSL